MASCAFCAIARGQDPSVKVVAEADDWVAFFPLEQATKGHTLVIPREHIPDLWHVKSPLDALLMEAVTQVGQAILAGLEPDGMNLITSAGDAAEQTVFHVHLHLVPRWADDGFSKIWPRINEYDDADLSEAADRIRGALQA